MSYKEGDIMRMIWDFVACTVGQCPPLFFLGCGGGGGLDYEYQQEPWHLRKRVQTTDYSTDPIANIFSAHQCGMDGYKKRAHSFPAPLPFPFLFPFLFSLPPLYSNRRISDDKRGAFFLVRVFFLTDGFSPCEPGFFFFFFFLI